MGKNLVIPEGTPITYLRPVTRPKGGIKVSSWYNNQGRPLEVRENAFVEAKAIRAQALTAFAEAKVILGVATPKDEAFLEARKERARKARNRARRARRQKAETLAKTT